MSMTATTIIENVTFVAIFLVCLYGLLVTQKYSKTVPGADLIIIGLLMYAIYGMLGWAAPGFTGSFIIDYSKVPVLKSSTFKYFLTYGLRLGLILILIGIFRVGRGLKT